MTPLWEKLKGRLLKGSFDKRMRIDPSPVPTPHLTLPTRFPFLTFFHADFGKEIPSRIFWRDPSRNCPSPSSALCPLLYRTEHFSRGRKWRKCAEKRRGRGLASKGGKKEKRTRENRSAFASFSIRKLPPTSPPNPTPNPSPSDLAHQNRTIAIASDFRVEGAKSQGSEIAAQNRKSLATFHRTLKSQRHIALSGKSLAISGVRAGHDDRKCKSQKSLRVQCAKPRNTNRSSHPFMKTAPGKNYPLVSARALGLHPKYGKTAR